jgi:hypothetical protein
LISKLLKNPGVDGIFETVHQAKGGATVKSTIMFKDDHLVRPETSRKPRRVGANDNLRSLEFEIEAQERDWRALCLVASVVCGFAVIIFAPLW